MSFVSQQAVRFAHCDPAGIAYYPRYFELLDYAVEDWTKLALGVTRSELHRDQSLGLPVVHLEATFSRPSRLGDLLSIAVAVTDVGRTSVTLGARIRCGDELRFDVTNKQVLMNLAAYRAVPWPPNWRARLLELRESPNG